MSRSFRKSFVSELKICCCGGGNGSKYNENSPKENRLNNQEGSVQINGGGARSISVVATRGESNSTRGRKSTSINSFKGRNEGRPFQTVT